MLTSSYSVLIMYMSIDIYPSLYINKTLFIKISIIYDLHYDRIEYI